MRPVTSQVAAEIGYDPAGGTDPGPFTQQVAERLHAADPRWGRRINSTGPISDDTVAYRGRDLPRQPPQHRYRTRRPYHPRPAPVAHLRSLGGDAGGASHYIPAYPGISRILFFVRGHQGGGAPVTFSSLRRLDDYSSEPLARSRLTAALFVGFAAIGLLLSTIGLYGVVTAHVAERTREVGIQMALGASRSVVLRAVLLEGAMMTLIGMIGGAATAALFSGWLESILYSVSRHDPATIAGVVLLVCLVTAVATYIPARRAASVEPTVALRE